MIQWETFWRSLYGLAPEAPQWLIVCLVVLTAFGFIVVPGAFTFSFVERKFFADLQARIGPNRTGRAGVLQPLADWLKLIQKRQNDLHSTSGMMWFFIYIGAIFSTIAILPLSSAFVLVDTELSAFVLLFVSLVASLSLFLLSVRQESVPSLLGGIRFAAQSVSGAFPALLSLLCVGMVAQSFKFVDLVEKQGPYPFQWLIFSNPFVFLAFFVFVSSGLVLLNLNPLNSGMSRSDINGGVESYLFGGRLTVFRLSRYYCFFLWSVVSVALFLGGWAIPEVLVEALDTIPVAIVFLNVFTLLLKTFFLMLLISWVSVVNPRVRSDQVTDFSWTVLSPVAIFSLVGCSIWLASLGGWG